MARGGQEIKVGFDKQRLRRWAEALWFLGWLIGPKVEGAIEISVRVPTLFDYNLGWKKQTDDVELTITVTNNSCNSQGVKR